MANSLKLVCLGGEMQEVQALMDAQSTAFGNAKIEARAGCWQPRPSL